MIMGHMSLGGLNGRSEAALLRNHQVLLQKWARKECHHRVTSQWLTLAGLWQMQSKCASDVEHYLALGTILRFLIWNLEKMLPKSPTPLIIESHSSSDCFCNAAFLALLIAIFTVVLVAHSLQNRFFLFKSGHGSGSFARSKARQTSIVVALGL